MKNQMNRIEPFLRRWKSEYDFSTFVGAVGSLAVTVVFALYNGFLGLRLSSLWHGSICAYYIVLALLRGLLVTAARRLSRRKRPESARDRVCLTASILLLILNLSLIAPISMMVVLQKPVHLTLIPAIAIAAHTTYKVTMASIHLSRRRTSADSLVRLLRTIGFIDALASILTLQNTLIMVQSGGEDIGLLPLTAASSAAVWIAVLLLSVAAIAKSVRRVRGGKKG